MEGSGPSPGFEAVDGPDGRDQGKLLRDRDPTSGDPCRQRPAHQDAPWTLVGEAPVFSGPPMDGKPLAMWRRSLALRH